MEKHEQKTPAFHIGICMAGAISAGAYTAGVMDYLLEALENWELAKKLQAEGKLSGVPKHDFKIEVLGGASAGGMTAAITAAGIQQKFDPVTREDENNSSVTKNNPLFNAWVNLKENDTNGNARDMMDFMLSTDDIENDECNILKEVRAGFNSTFIKDIADEMLGKTISDPYKRNYVADDIDVFTTITNLRGFDYKVVFQTSSGTREHRMKMHRDYAFFKLDNVKTDVNDVAVKSNNATNAIQLESDGRIPINFNSGLNIDILKDAAMSTGAFPVGLESRELKRHKIHIENNKYLNLIISGQNSDQVKYSFLPQDDEYLSLNVDGGVINNEPYEVTHQLLDDRRKHELINVKVQQGKDLQQAVEEVENEYKSHTTAKEFENVVLMIDPFPNDEESNLNEYIPKKAWQNVLPSILSAMRGQLMMKDEQIKRAYLSEDYTRFLIMPVRTHNNARQTFSIACGSLGGFGGFFSKSFRVHDFYLGRRNCQKFLKDHFNVPEEAGNHILKYGYDDKTITKGRLQHNGKKYLSILPDIRIEGDELSGYRIVEPKIETEYAYPKIKLSYILSLRDKFIRRIKCLMDNIENPKVKKRDDQVPPGQSDIVTRLRKKSWIQKAFTPIKKGGLIFYLSIAKYFGKGVAADYFIDTIINDMDKRGLIDDDLLK